MHNRERNNNRSGPGRHLVDELAKQHYLGRDGRTIFPGVQIEEAEVYFDVAVGRLNTAQGENPVAGLGQPGVVVIDACEFEREIGFHRRAQVGRTLRIDVEAAVWQLAIENRPCGLVDERTCGWIPDTVYGGMKPKL